MPAEAERISGFTRFGPPVPGVGPILGVTTFNGKIFVARSDGDAPRVYYLYEQAQVWRQLGPALSPQ